MGDNVIAMSDTAKPSQDTAPASSDKPPQETKQHLQIDDAQAICSYANFCRVTGTPEELVVDFALNSQPFGVPTEPMKITQRLVINYFTAKRLLQALHLSVQRHEQAFGVLETDVQKRVVSGRAVGG